jgi:hypothetical protein
MVLMKLTTAMMESISKMGSLRPKILGMKVVRQKLTRMMNVSIIDAGRAMGL